MDLRKKLFAVCPNSLVFAFNCHADRLVRVSSCPAARCAPQQGRTGSPARTPTSHGPSFLYICHGNLCQPLPHGLRAGGHTSHCPFALLHPLFIFPDKAVMETDLGLFSSLDRVLEQDVAAQIVPFPFETDGGAPALLPGPPLHAGDAAGIIFADGLGAEHFHTGPIDVGQAGPADRGRGLSEELLVTAAGGPVAVPEALGKNDSFLSAVAAAAPRGLGSEILRRFKDREFPKPLPGQIQFLT